MTRIKLVGIGIFSLLAIFGTEEICKELIRLVLLSSDAAPVAVFWVNTLVGCVVLTGLAFIIRYRVSRTRDVRKFLIYAFVAYWITQLLQFALLQVSDYFLPANYDERLTAYTVFRRSNVWHEFSALLVRIFCLLTVFLMFLPVKPKKRGG